MDKIITNKRPGAFSKLQVESEEIFHKLQNKINDFEVSLLRNIDSKQDIIELGDLVVELNSYLDSIDLSEKESDITLTSLTYYHREVQDLKKNSQQHLEKIIKRLNDIKKSSVSLKIDNSYRIACKALDFTLEFDSMGKKIDLLLNIFTLEDQIRIGIKDINKLFESDSHLLQKRSRFFEFLIDKISANDYRNTLENFLMEENFDPESKELILIESSVFREFHVAVEKLLENLKKDNRVSYSIREELVRKIESTKLEITESICKIDPNVEKDVLRDQLDEYLSDEYPKNENDPSYDLPNALQRKHKEPSTLRLKRGVLMDEALKAKELVSDLSRAEGKIEFQENLLKDIESLKFAKLSPEILEKELESSRQSEAMESINKKGPSSILDEVKATIESNSEKNI